MSQPAINLVNPAAACPPWCTSAHEGDRLVPREDERREHLAGEWYATHEGAEDIVYTDEPVAPGLTNNIRVRSEAFACSTPDSCYPRSVAVNVISTYGSSEVFTLTARQALRLAEVLVQHAAAVLAEDSATLEVTR